MATPIGAPGREQRPGASTVPTPIARLSAMQPDDHPIEELDIGPDDEFAPWDGRRVPVTLIGGYLGAGKTTAINGLLARTDRPIAVLVNDVGSVNIDARLIRRHSGDTIELTDGCVCCSMRDGLGQAFEALRRRSVAPDHVLIELSGVADPAQVTPWGGSLGFRLDGVVVLVDADQFLDRVDDPLVGGTVRTQLVAADLFVLTKTDLADAATRRAVGARLAAEAPSTPVLSVDSAEAIAGFLGTGTRTPGGVAATPTPTLFDGHRTTTVPLPDPIDLDRIDSLLDGLGPETMRAKGVARLPDGTLQLIQVVGRRRAITPLPAAESEPPTDLVVIAAAGGAGQP